MGVGLVARGSDGQLIEAKAIVYQEKLSLVVAEAMTVKEALSGVDSMQWPCVTVESDCLTVIQAMRSKASMRSKFGRIISECRNIMFRLNKIVLLFVKRFANMVAHQLTRES